jgi:iron complex transport system substrate-binding protein
MSMSNRAALSRRALLAAVPGLAAPAVVRAQDADATPDAATPAASPAGGWSFTDDRGVTVSLSQRPERIVAQTTSAAALWDYGVRPVGIFGPYRLADGTPDFQAGNIDLDAVEHLGDYPEMDLEKLVALQPELYVDLTLYDGAFWYLGENQERIEEIVPTLGISMQGVSILTSIERFEELAGALGADLSAPEVVEAKAAFAEAEADLKAAIAEKPGLTVLVTSPSIDNIYIASPDWMVDLYYFRELGLDIVTHNTDDFFELLSWEQANTYPADLILVDQRASDLSPEQLAEIPTWSALPAVQAGQVGPWYAGAPYSHARLVPIMQELTEIIRASRADVV